MTDERERQELIALGRDICLDTFGTLDLHHVAARLKAQDRERTRAKIKVVWNRDKQ